MSARRLSTATSSARIETQKQPDQHYTETELQKQLMASATQNKIRIRLKAYDTSAIESAAKEIVETATRTGARCPDPCRYRPRRTSTA